MKDINSIFKKAQDDLFPELEAKIRAELETKDKNWLIDQIILLTCERHSLHEQHENLQAAKKFIRSIKERNYTYKYIQNFVTKYKGIKREDLEESNILINAPHMGLDVLESKHLSLQGQTILQETKEILYVLLYDDININTIFTREKEEILIMTIPTEKLDALSFLKATTEIKCEGIWKDPEGISNDEHANNTELHVEFGDYIDQRISEALFVVLNLLNLLLINEQIFYVRTTNVMRSSL
ncbi:hypothetical protein [Wenyingzhuangia sp. IMCC45574]